jgi:hypothetical protein
MKSKFGFIILLSTFCLPAWAQGTAFTYQGRLNDTNGPANGVYDLRVILWSLPSGGVLPIGTQIVDDVGVTNGLFTALLDFGANAFNGNDRWLELTVRPGASEAAYTVLAPRQQLTPTAYAIRALNVGTNGLAAGTYANAVTLNNPANHFTGTFTGNGAGLTNLAAVTFGGLGLSNFWQTGGNGGTMAGTHFLGSTDNQPLELKVNGARALRLEPTAGAPNVIGGAAVNVITAPSAGGGVLSGAGHRIFNASDYSVIAGGFSNRIQIQSPGGAIGGGQRNWIVNSSTNSVIAGGASNQVSRDHAFIGGGLQQTNRSAFTFIGGGYRNEIGTDSDYGAIGGGRDNAIAANSPYATIAGGYLNDIGTNSYYSAISGGINNNIAANSLYATIAGGGANDIGTSADYSAIGGGRVNTIAATSLYATIAGGYLNEILNSSDFSVVAGGFSNRVQVSSPGGAIGGGQLNRINNYNTNSVIAGGYANQIGVLSDAAAISGGKENLVANDSSYAAIAGGYQNDIATASRYSAIGGGRDNNIAANSVSATIPGGYVNNIGTNSDYSTIGGGVLNQVSANTVAATIAGGRDNLNVSDSAAIGGGEDNRIETDSPYATIGGGWLNIIRAYSRSSTIGGGRENRVLSNAFYATISGGQNNWVESFADYSTIGGGDLNTVRPFAKYATIPGGSENSAAADYTFAAGQRAQALHAGSFVWADSQPVFFSSTRTNQFNIRASGGVRLSDDTPNLSFGSRRRQMIQLYGSDNTAPASNYGIGVQSSCFYQRSNADFSWFKGGVHVDERNDPGPEGFELMRLQLSGLTVFGAVTATAFNTSSDRNVKENFKPVDPRAVLAKVVVLPLSEWNYKSDTASRHVGPMAQDFHTAFGLGTDDKHIATVDADGVALAAIQGLNQKLEETRAENAALRRELSEIKQLLTKLTTKGN